MPASSEMGRSYASVQLQETIVRDSLAAVEQRRRIGTSRNALSQLRRDLRPDQHRIRVLCPFWFRSHAAGFDPAAAPFLSELRRTTMSRAIRGLYKRFTASGEYTWYIAKYIKRVDRLCESREFIRFFIDLCLGYKIDNIRIIRSHVEHREPRQSRRAPLQE